MSFDEKSRQAGRLLFVLDMLLTVLVFLVSYRMREFFFSHNPADYFSHLALLPLVLALQGALLAYSGIYRGLRISSVFSFVWSILRVLLISIVTLSTIIFLLKAQYVSRSFLVIFYILDLVVLVFVRLSLIWWYFLRSREKHENYLKVLIIGTGNRAKHLSHMLQKHAEWGIDVIGYLDIKSRREDPKNPSLPVIGTVDCIGRILKERVVDEVIVAMPRSVIKDVQSIADACEEEGVRLRFMADIFDLEVSRLQLVHLGNIPLLTFEPVAQDDKKLIIKRIFDLTLTLAAIPVMLPVMLVIALAIKVDSPGPAFFFQNRVGLRKRPFRMIKFRSMYQGSEEKLKDLESINEAEGPIFKISNDPRITRVGKFLRKTSLDELPQLFNVIRGHMSLVGPRPMSLRDVNLFDRGIQRKRFSVRPGLTCLWQISGRSNLPFSKWLELDLAYIDSWSLGLDFKILLKTIPIVLKGSGAV